MTAPKFPPGSTAAEYLQLVDLYGACVCDDWSCHDDLRDGDGCLLCNHLDPEWPCPAEADADYPKVVS